MMRIVLACMLMVGAYGLQVAMPSYGLQATRPRAAIVLMTSIQEPQQEDAADALTMLAVMDLDGNGGVSPAEFGDYLAQYSYTEKASQKIFSALDANGDGEISLEELTRLASFASAAPAPELVEQVNAEADAMFDAIDINQDGSISSAELGGHLMDIGYTAIASDAVLRSLDSNKDGVLSRIELRTGFLKYSALRQAVVALVKELVMTKRW